MSSGSLHCMRLFILAGRHVVHVGCPAAGTPRFFPVKRPRLGCMRYPSATKAKSNSPGSNRGRGRCRTCSRAVCTQPTIRDCIEQLPAAGWASQSQHWKRLQKADICHILVIQELQVVRLALRRDPVIWVALVQVYSQTKLDYCVVSSSSHASICYRTILLFNLVCYYFFCLFVPIRQCSDQMERLCNIIFINLPVTWVSNCAK